MAQPELHLANATVVLPGSAPARADLLIGGGRILHVGPVGEGVAAHETVDLSGLTVMPGAVDVHLHLDHRRGAQLHIQPSPGRRVQCSHTWLRGLSR